MTRSPLLRVLSNVLSAATVNMDRQRVNTIHQLLRHHEGIDELSRIVIGIEATNSHRLKLCRLSPPFAVILIGCLPQKWYAAFTTIFTFLIQIIIEKKKKASHAFIEKNIEEEDTKP